MKKLSLTIGIFLITACILFAQAPQSFKYQAIARDVEGNIISNKEISLRINLLRGSKSGKLVYSEIHDVQTTDFGLILLEIGNGDNKSGDFSSIDWGNDSYYVSIEIDKNGGSDFISMGTSQLLSVPYALYAETSGSSSGSKETMSWIDGSGATYLANSGWNVGIGTSAPSSKLDVIGKGTFENVYVTKTDITTASGHQVANKFEVLYEPTSSEPTSSSAVKGSSVQIKAVTADPTATDFTNFLQGLRFSLIHRNNGTIAQLIGGRFQMGMPTGAWGGTGTTGTINSMRGIDMELYGMKGTVAYGTGISLESIGSNFSNLTYLRINQPTDVAGNFGIYNNSTYDNYFAGNVGIGTTAPAGILDIAGAYHFPSTDGKSGQVLQTNGSGALSWRNGGVSEINDLKDGKTVGQSVFLGEGGGDNDDGTNNQNVSIGINALGSNTSGYSNTATGHMALISNTIGIGNVAIGYMAGPGEADSNKLYIENSNSLNPLIWGDFAFDRIVINGNSTHNINNRTFFSNGEAGGTTAWFNDSDIRLKKNISTISSSLDKVLHLRGVNYEWKETENHAEGLQMGFIAQEVIEVIPEVVDFSGDNYSMQYAPITAVLVEAVKEQQKMIADQQKQIDELKLIVSRLKD